QTLVVLESMKMEHVVVAGRPGTVSEVLPGPGDTVEKGDRLVVIEPGSGPAAAESAAPSAVGGIRPELEEVLTRRLALLDESRPEAMERRHGTGHRSARENLADLCDPGSFVEYGGLVVAAQRRRRSVEELIERTPADGLVGGIARVNGERFGPDRSRCAVISYDYTVLAGTQGHMNHRKKDRLFDVIERLRLPLVLFAEGGGGRPGDTDGASVTGLETEAFARFARLSGLAPMVGVVGGRCFAGNAALLGCCDVIIATADTTLGMGGPAMIEGGGLGVFPPEAVGPMSVQVPNGVVDVAVADDAEAVAMAKQYLSYFQGPIDRFECADQEALRVCVPEDRRRVYDVHSVIELVADTGSVLELRPEYGLAMVTALARLEGRPVGIVANNPIHLAGAIDAFAANKAARFLQLCDAFDLPVVYLCDTPGFMVGPEAETAALVRHAGRLFVVGASLTVPFCTVVLRKGYGLGAQAMAGGSFREPLWIGSWPTGEFGGMGLEGAVRLGYRRELEAVENPEEREALFNEMVERSYRIGKALNVATYFEVDEVIDPAETRQRVAAVLGAAPAPPVRTAKKRPVVDPW
ncbi:MAG: carboxyl transferase domain-containing protein, partial [Acidimicrobiales bacterium]